MDDKFNISSKGFLEEKCMEKLPNKFIYFQNIYNNLDETKSDSIQFRNLINELPEYNYDRDNINDLSITEIKKMYSFLSMTINRYIWCSGVNDASNYSILPSILGKIFFDTSKYLGINPSLTHAAVDLYNWKYIKNENEFSLDNIDVISTMTGDISEKWFYKIMIVIEGNSYLILKSIYDLIENIKNNNYNNINDNMLYCFKCINECMLNNYKIIKKMELNCDPHFFFNHLRIYLSGSRNDNLPNGITVKDFLEIKFDYVGGSAAQSTLLPVIDQFLSIKHDDHTQKYLTMMLDYMPEKHRNFIKYVKDNMFNVHNYVNLSNDKNLIDNYNKALSNLKSFRTAHLSLIHKYIINQIPKTNNNNAHGEKGSGGTSPVDFANSIIKSTNKNYIKYENKNYYNYNIYYIIVFIVMWLLWHYYT